MTVQRFRWIAVVASLLSIAVSGVLEAQMPMGQPLSYAPQPVAYGVAPGHGGTPAITPHGAGFSFVSPAHYAGGDGMVFQGPMIMGDGESCDCDECMGMMHGGRRGHRLGQGLMSILAMLAPYGEGGCCAPHWFDIHAEAVFLNLNNHGRFVEFSRNTGEVSQITSRDLGFSVEPGLRVTGAYQTGPGSNLEFTYLGMFDHATRRTVEGNEDLNSVFSDFTLQTPDFQGLEQFDLANLHQVLHASNFDSLELNYRRRWTGPTCSLQGSWLVGIRYARIHEKIRWFSQADRLDNTGQQVGGDGFFNLDATNYMTGAQLGGDVWLCILPGLNIGIDGKFGLYGNNASQRTEMYGIDPVTGFDPVLPPEKVSNDKVTFIGELNLMATYRLNHQFTIRGGYQMLFVEGVATAMNNFNPEVPDLTTRTPFLADGEKLFYDGFSIGAEWMW